MAWPLEWSPAAAIAVEEEASKYARQREEAIAEALDELEVTIARIAEGPSISSAGQTIRATGER